MRGLESQHDLTITCLFLVFPVEFGARGVSDPGGIKVEKSARFNKLEDKYFVGGRALPTGLLSTDSSRSVGSACHDYRTDASHRTPLLDRF